MDQTVLLGLLSSTLTKYFAKAFVNHGVDAQLDDLPIVLPSAEETSRIRGIVETIIASQKANRGYDYRPDLANLDEVVATMYGLTQSERTEVSTWYRRHYPKLTGDGAEEA